MSRITEKYDHKLKIRPEYYEAVIDGSKPFEIRSIEDRTFKEGEIVVLREYEGHKYIEECERYKHLNCEGWKAIEDIPEYGEDEAIDECGKNRRHCCDYFVRKYTGRECWIRIKKIFDIGKIVEGFVVFTFDILKTEETRPWKETEEHPYD